MPATSRACCFSKACCCTANFPSRQKDVQCETIELMLKTEYALNLWIHWNSLVFIGSQNFVLVQPRTSPPKICKIFEKCIFEKCIFEKWCGLQHRHLRHVPAALALACVGEPRDAMEEGRYRVALHVAFQCLPCPAIEVVVVSRRIVVYRSMRFFAFFAHLPTPNLEPVCLRYVEY